MSLQDNIKAARVKVKEAEKALSQTKQELHSLLLNLHYYLERETKPFEIGQKYRRLDGKEVTCIKLTDLKGYECAQFDDYEETYIRSKEQHPDMPMLDFKPEQSGHRYNRASDRGRCTGSSMDWSEPFNVMPVIVVRITKDLNQ